MRRFCLVCGMLAAVLAAGAAAAMPAAPSPESTRYAVTRDGDRIGTTTVRVHRDGDNTIAWIATHIAVKIAFITVYHYDQTETERWAGNRLIAMTARTDDNGTIHKVEARRAGDALTVDADGRVRTIAAGIIPASPWNPSLIRQKVALDPQNGRLTQVSVVDHGEERLLLDGRPMAAHHYSIRTTFPQDVWYDRSDRLVKVEMHESDGSTIRYQPG